MILHTKRLTLIFGVIFISFQSSFSQHVSKNNYTGGWETPTSWIPTWTVPQTTNINNNITIYGFITRNGTLICLNNSADMIVSDTLVIIGNLTIGHNNHLTVSDNGILIIRGDLILDDDATVDANGYLIVTGDVDKIGGTSHQYIRSNDNPVKVFVGGTIANALLNKTWNPVFECATAPSIPYTNSACSYGNMTDIINDPIYSFFQSTCLVPQPTVIAGGPTTFCSGGSVTLTSSAGSTYLWSTGASTASVNISASGSYTVRITNPGGCLSSASTAVTVTVNPVPVTPVISASGPTTFCSGGSVTLTSSPGTSYLWSTGATTASINVNASGSYKVRVTNASGCQSAPSVATVVTVNALPATPTITAGGPKTFCAGGSVTLTSSAGSTYLWSTGSTAASINVTTAGSYTVRVTNSNGCQSAASAATVVTVNSLPAVPTITAGGPTTFCAGGNVTLTSSAGTSYLWSNAATTQSINVTTTGSYTVQVKNASGCQSAPSVATVVTVNALPVTPTIISGGPTTFCAGGSVTLTSSAGTSYLWSNAATTPSINVTTTGSYTVQVTNASGCQSAPSVAIVVTVNALPATPIITAGGPTTFCVGGSVTLTSSAGTTYLWSNAATTQSINVTTAGSYTVQVTNLSGCQSAASAATVININSLPVVNAGTDVTIPNGTSTTINATVTGTGPFTYSWSPAGQLVNPLIEDPTTVNLNTTTIFRLTAASIATSCYNSNSVTITITGGPLSSSPTATPGTVCAGESVQLNALAGGGSGSYMYTWTSTPAGFTSSIADPVVNPTVNTTYNVTVFDGFTTVNSQVVVTVNALPATPTITAGGPTTFCAGGNVTLTSSAGTTYLWSTGASTASVNVTNSGSYTVRVINASGCQSAASTATVVTVNALPATPTITSFDPTTFCAGDSVTLTSSAGTTYLWSNAATTPSINVTTTGSYTVQVTNASGCQSAPSVATVVTVNALPATPTITAGGPTTFCAGGSVTLTSSAGTTYLWSNTATTQSINVATAGSYTVQVTNVSGCQSAASAPTVVIVDGLPATPTITEGGPTTFCDGANVTLTSSAGTTYLWSTGATTASINVTTSGNYSVLVTNASGCQSAESAATVVTVNALPAVPTITAVGPTTFCTGGGVTLTSSAGTSYFWLNAATTQSINVTTAGSYTVQVTNASGCQSATSVATVVTVNALPAIPTITAGGPTTFCDGDSVTLNSGAGSTYLWSNTATTPGINVTSSGSYSVQVTDANGCQSAASAATVVIVNSLPAVPTITAGGPTTFCAGGNVTLTSSAGTTHLWSTGATTASINVTTSGNYSVLVTNASGCQSAASTATMVTVNALPAVPNITAVGPTTFCTGGGVTLTSSAGTSYLWLNAATTQSINVTTAGNYTVQVTNANGCQSAVSLPVVVTVNALPLVTAGNSGPVCPGTVLNLTGGPGGMTVYSWSGPGGFISTLQNPSVTSSATSATGGVYSLRVTNSNGCTKTASTTVVINSLPQVNITSNSSSMCVSDVRTLTGIPIGGSFSITSGPGILNGNILRATGSGNINVEYKYTDVCINKATQSITVNDNPLAIAGPDQDLTFVFETQMKAELSGSETGEWSIVTGSAKIIDSHSPTTLVTELQPGDNKFLWKVKNGYCEASSLVKITIRELFVPSVITPDGDGKNDYFIISKNIGRVELIIFNKWGIEEYRNSNYKNDWDGRNRKGTELPFDTYFYVMKFENGKIKKGTVLIKR